MAGGALSFREDPFRLTPDRRYIFETDGFRRAFAALLSAVQDRRGVVLLTGPSGTGKTTLLQGLLAKLQQDGCVAFWRFHPDIPGYDVVGSCLAELEITDASTVPVARAQALARALTARDGAAPAVVIVDEAGQFTDAQLAELASLPAATGNAVQVVLAGLPAFAERLEGDPLADVRNAVTLRAELGPLDRSELGAYIAHRCRVAGQSSPLVFEPQAIGRVFHHTGGTPRLVNRLCATALFFAEPESKQISAAVVDEAARACSAAASADPKEQPAMPQRSAVPAAAAAAEKPELREAPSEVHRTLAEAERAWIAGATMPVAPAATSAPPASDKADWPVDASAADEDVPAAPVAAAKRRSPALRIAASIIIVAGSAAALGAVLWPTIGRETLADFPPVRAIARLLSGEEAAVAPSAAPVAVVAAVATKVEPASAAPLPPAAAPVETAQPRPAPAEPPPAAVAVVPATVEPARATPLPPATAAVETTQPRPAAAEPPPAAVAVVAKVEPEPAPAPPPAAAPVEAKQPQPALDAPPLTAAPTPEPLPPAPSATPPVVADAPAAPVEAAAAVPASAEPALAAAVAAIEPANGPEPVADEAPAEGAAPVAASLQPAIEPEPKPVALAALTPPADPAPTAVSPAPAPEPSAVAVIAPPPQPVAPAPRVAQAAAPPAVSPAELQQLMARGDEMLRLGDPASARLFYERAAARGHPGAFTAVGRTFDPLVLRSLSIRGGGANGERALAWYRRGAEAGDSEASRAADELTAWLARSR